MNICQGYALELPSLPGCNVGHWDLQSHERTPRNNVYKWLSITHLEMILHIVEYMLKCYFHTHSIHEKYFLALSEQR